jgi:hypothetical protein
MLLNASDATAAWVKQGLPYCKQCNALHDDKTGMVDDLKTKGTICEKCHGLKGTNGHGTTPCKARALAHAMCARGLLSVRRWHAEDGFPGITSPTRHAAAMLKTFGHPVELVRSNYNGSTPAAFDCWTNQEGIDTLVMIQTIARNFLAVCNPVAARLLLACPDIFAEFRTLWRLDAPEKTLAKVIEPLKSMNKADVKARLAEVPKLRKRTKPCR